MLSEKHENLFSRFYESTHHNEHLDDKTIALVGLAAGIALNCYSCMEFYIDKAKEHKVSRGEIGEVLAKVMAVAAGQKRVQLKSVYENFEKKDETNDPCK